MRIRTIKPEFFKHDVVASLDPRTRLLFIGLWCLADCAGRLDDRPRRIGVEVLPYDQDYDVDAGLDSLNQHGLIQRYSADGMSLIQVVSFASHQRITGKEAESTSRFPEPTRETLGKQPGNNRETTETTGNGRETERKRVLVRTVRAAVAAPPNDSDWFDTLRRNPAYQSLNIDAEFAKMRTWCDVNKKQPSRRRFVNWLNRCEKPMQPTANRAPERPQIPEPTGWREYMQSEYPGCVFVDESSPRYAATWAQLPADYQKLVADKLNKRSAA